MKKIVVVSLVGLILLASLAGCAKPKGSEADTGAGITAEQKEKLAQTLSPIVEKATNHLTLRQYDEVIAMFDDAMKKALPKDKLKEAWLETAGDIGKFEEITSIELKAETADKATMIASCKFTQKILLISYGFNSDNQISGLWLSYGTEEVAANETDVYKETPVELGFKEPLLKGMLTLPKNVENPPVVIFVHGSGTSDMNETIGACKPFEDLAYGLAEHGIASIRYDKRYYANPETLAADLKTLTIKDEALGDVGAAISLAKGRDDIDKSKIYILGHSLGGMLIPKIAEENSDIAGAISMAGTLRKIEDIMRDQTVESLEASGLSKEEQAAQLDKADEMYAQIKAINSDEGEAIFGYPATYWNSLNQIDGVALAKKLTIPLLILQGSADFQVYPETDFKLWKDTLSGKDNATFKEYEGLNHLMMPTTGARDITDYDTANNVAKEVIDDIAAFIK